MTDRPGPPASLALALDVCDREPVDDAGLVAACLAGDGEAFARIYDRYADRLHDFCHSILRDRHEAADALQDTMLVAHQRLHQLRDPERLRPWLFSIARHEAYKRTRQRQRATPTDTTALDSTALDMTAPDTNDEGIRAAEASRIVWDAAAGLDPRDQVVLDLHVRQGLSGADLAEALGVKTHHADVLVSRVRQRVERSLGALLVSRMGRDDCPDLAEVLRGWDGTFSVLMRKRVARHVDGCDVCEETRAKVAGAVALLGAMPLVPAPPALRDRILGEVDRIASHGPRGGATKRWRPPPLPDRSRRRRLGAAACVALVAGAGLVLSLDDRSPTGELTVAAEADGDEADAPAPDDDGGAEPTATGTSGQPTDAGDQPAGGPPPDAPTEAGPGGPGDPGDPSAPGGASPGTGDASGPGDPGPAGPPGGDPPDVAPPPGTGTPPDPAPPTTDPPAAPAELSLSTSSLALTSEAPAASFTVRNTGGRPLAWTASADGFGLSDTGGTIAPGLSATVEVTLPAGTPEGDHPDAIEVRGGGRTRTVDVAVDRRPRITEPAVAPASVPCGGSVRASARIADESSLRVVAEWSTPSRRGEVPMTSGSGGLWTASIPVVDGPMVVRIAATDARRNSATADAGTVTVGPCRVTPGR